MLLIRKFYVLILISFPFIIFSCNNVQDKMEIEKSASAFDIKQGEASILQSNQHFMKSFETGDSVGVSNCYATDAKAMVPNQPTITGRENIKHFISETMAKGIIDFDLHTIKIWGDSSILAEEGVYRLTGKEKSLLDKGKYLVLWKQEAGNWKMYRDIWASDLPAQVIQPKKIDLPKK